MLPIIYNCPEIEKSLKYHIYAVITVYQKILENTVTVLIRKLIK